MATKKEYKTAIKGTRGIYIKIADNLKVSRSAVSQYLAKHDDMRALADQEKQKAIDCAEDTIYTMATMKTSDPKKLPVKLKAAERIVNTQGKNRGWVERKELEHTGDGLKIIIEKADKGEGGDIKP